MGNEGTISESGMIMDHVHWFITNKKGIIGATSQRLASTLLVEQETLLGANLYTLLAQVGISPSIIDQIKEKLERKKDFQLDLTYETTKPNPNCGILACYLHNQTIDQLDYVMWFFQPASTEIRSDASFHKILNYILLHDLSSQIGSINNLLSLKSHKDPDFDFRTFTSLALKSLTAFAQDLKNLIRAWNQNQELQKETINVRSVCEEVLTLSKGVSEVHVELSVPHDQTIYSIKAYLVSILYNLIANALQHGSATDSKIIVRSSKGEHGLDIQVIDNGPGLTSDQIASDIFRLHYTTHSGKQGTGIGLYLAKELVTVLQGEIKAEKNPDGGSIFTVTIQ